MTPYPGILVQKVIESHDDFLDGQVYLLHHHLFCREREFPGRGIEVGRRPDPAAR